MIILPITQLVTVLKVQLVIYLSIFTSMFVLAGPVYSSHGYGWTLVPSTVRPRFMWSISSGRVNCSLISKEEPLPELAIVCLHVGFKDTPTLFTADFKNGSWKNGV